MSIIYPNYVAPKDNQVQHFNNAETILSKKHLFVDYSPTGRGKTYPPLYIAQKHNLSILIFCPLTIEGKWRKTVNEYGIKLIDIISYQSLRSTKGKQPKHGYLERKDAFDLNANINKCSFEATDKYLQLLELGVIIVFDEAQHLKNRSDQWKAAHALIKPFYNKDEDEVKLNPNSGYILASATLFDKEEHSLQFVELIGIKNAHFMYRNVGKIFEYEQHGLGEIIKAAEMYDVEKTQQILKENKFKLLLANFFPENRIGKICEKIVYELLVGVIRANIGSCITEDKMRDYKKSNIVELFADYFPSDVSNILANYYYDVDKKNKYYNVSAETANKLRANIRKLSSAVGFDPERNQIDPSKFGAAVVCLNAIEANKCEIFIRDAKEILQKHPNDKVILFLNYLDNIDTVYNGVKEYGTIKLTGATKNRSQLIDKFNNDPNCRILVGTTSTGGVGIDLDDKIGNSVRHMRISPDYSIIKSHQATGRIDRQDTKSVGNCKFVYAKIMINNALITEIPILNAMAKKTAVLKKINGETQLFPGDYPNEIEE